MRELNFIFRPSVDTILSVEWSLSEVSVTGVIKTKPENIDLLTHKLDGRNRFRRL